MKLSDIQTAMNEFLKETSLNVLAELNSIRIYDAPLLAVADAQDPLFEQLKK